jgi:hypothetical protein
VTAPNLGDLITTIYAEFLAQYGDEEIASVATAAVINDLLTHGRRDAGEECDDAPIC